MKNNKKFIRFLLGILFCLNILAWIVVFDLSKSKFLEVNFFDVGQGDAIFIETPKRHQILIDGGPSSTILEKLAKEMPFWDRSIDLIILTHPEQDHLTGLLEVLKKYKIENILWTGIQRDTAEFREWQNLMQEEKARIFIAESGQKIKWSRTVLDHFEVLYPFDNLEEKEFKDSNNTSIISKLVFGENSFLFTGDAYKSVEKELIEGGADIDADVLKVAHHGSKTSNSEEFIVKVSPKIAIISVSGDKKAEGDDCDNEKRNKYGHPNCQVLETLAKYDIRTLRTDKDGDIKIISDGITYKIK